MTTLNPNFHARPILYDIKQSPDTFSTYTTTNTYQVMYTWITQFMGMKYITITNSGSKSANIKILGSYDGASYNFYLLPAVTLAAGSSAQLEVASFFASLQILAESTTTNQATTLNAQVVATSHIVDDTDYATQFETINVTSSAVSTLTQSKCINASTAFITVETNPVRVRWDGGAPTNSVGHLVNTGDDLQLTSVSDLVNFQAIGSTGAAVLQVTYSR